ncbi:hypothetical protein TrVGV298_002037 [Trichoderma virens]|nr:hypothetical protein TrVGV298_002037 [Trichoderma virens]
MADLGLVNSNLVSSSRRFALILDIFNSVQDQIITNSTLSVSFLVFSSRKISNMRCHLGRTMTDLGLVNSNLVSSSRRFILILDIFDSVPDQNYHQLDLVSLYLGVFSSFSVPLSPSFRAVNLILESSSR